MKIIIADDSKVMRQIVLRTMRQAGFGHHDFVEAVDGAEAYQLVASESMLCSSASSASARHGSTRSTTALPTRGGVFGFVTSVVMIPEKNVWFAITLNSEDSDVRLGLMYELLDHYVGAPKKDWPVARCRNRWPGARE